MSILVAIPSVCVEDGMGPILCPLQVELEGSESGAEYYNSSNGAVDDYFLDGNTTSIVDLLNSSVEIVTSTSINVRMGIETEGTFHSQYHL